MAGASPSGASLIGQTIESYRIVAKIGAGGMGEVYQAEDLKLGRVVALKFLPREVHASERSRELFLQEARSASALDHPNIGVIHTIGEAEDGRLFLVMACYEGETLAARIARGPLPPQQAIDIAAQIARGLAEAHGRQIVHRDIKPSNVLITRQGLVKIVDFGLARVIGSAESTASTTLSGTAAYMSPEQALGRALDRRTDIWSLGVALYEMLTGRLPFEGESAPTRLYAVVHASPAELKEVPAALQAVVYRALAKDAQQRYQSAAELLADLEALQSGTSESPTRLLTKPGFADALANASGQESGAAAPSRRTALWLAGAFVLCLAALAFLLLRDRIAPVSAERHLALLPLTARGFDGPGSSVADGITESLTGRLSNLDAGDKSLWVVPVSEVRRRKVDDAASARKEFGANLVVTGSVERQGNGARLILNLVDAKNVRQLGSADATDRAGDYAALQDEAVAKLARLMNLRVARETAATHSSAKPAAYEAYLSGIGLLQRYDRPGNLDQAITLLGSATGQDPQFALGFASLAEAYLLKHLADQNPQWLDRAAAECRRAIELNDQLSPVHVILGRVHNSLGHIDLALQEFQRALELDPRNPDALRGTARVYETQGRVKEAEETYRRSAALRPEDWDGYNSLGQFFLRVRRFPDAVAQFRKVVELTPDNANGYLNLGAALSNDRKVPEAIQALQTSLRLAPSYGAHTNLGNIYYRDRRWEPAAREYEAALQLNDQDFRPWLNLAGAYRRLGRAQDAQRAAGRGIPLLERVAGSRPQDAAIEAALGWEYAKAGHRDKAVPRLEAALALAPKDASVLQRAGESYEILGDRSRAVEFMNRAVASGYPFESLKNDPDMQAIINDPRFKAPSH